MLCSSCRAEVPAGARFCPACGQDQQVRGDERRVVTVLFADLVGFTALAEARDPEQVKNLVDLCFQRLVADIEAFGGRVDKIVGDAVVALFGAPLAHEDDAERAVRAALAMQATLDRVAVEVGVPVRMRIGVNTGEVLVGALRAGGDYTAMGDVVNTASRLQASARPGRVLVGPATHAATHRVITYEAVGDVVARGREAPVPTWLAVEALLPPGHRPDRGRVPLVGRDAELAVFDRSLGVAVAGRRALFGLLLGDAGVGKSRLAEELARRAQEGRDALVLEGRCVPYGEANVWWPVADALRHGCGIRSTDAAEVAAERTARMVRDALGDGVPDEEHDRVLTGLLALMGHDTPLQAIDPTRAREAATTALVTFIRRLTDRRPVVVVLSDLHWADDLVLGVVETLLERLVDRPFVLLATARGQLDERWSPPAGRHNVARLTLDPLGDEAAAEMLRALLGADPGVEATAALLDRAGGNPFFLEELVALVGAAGPAGGAGPEGGGELPDTLRGLVAARLDGLSGDERRVLECCAILGRKGPVRAITTMAGYYLSPDAVASALDGLVGKDLLEVTGADGGARWSFRSDLVREVAYGTLTKGERARGHAGIAGWMERHEDLDRDANVDRVTHHWTRAAEVVAELGSVDGVPVQAIDRALAWIERAAGRADAADVPIVAARLYGEGLALLAAVDPVGEGAGLDGAGGGADGGGADDPQRRAFLLGRARALAALHELGQAGTAAEVARRAAVGAGDAASEARALLVLAGIAQRQARWQAADELLDRAAACSASAGDGRGEAEALRLRGFGALFQSDHGRASELLDAALEWFVALGDRRGEAWALQNLAWCAFATGRADEAEARLRVAAGVFGEIGDAGGLGWARGLLAYTRFMQGHVAEAGALAETVRAEARERGDRWGTGMMLVLTAQVRLWTGRTREAVDRAREAADLFARIDDDYGATQAAAVLGRALVATGCVEEGVAVLVELGGRPEAPVAGVLGRAVLLAVAVHLGDVDLGRRALDATPPGTLDPGHAGHASDRPGSVAAGPGDEARPVGLPAAGSALEGELATSAALHLLQRGEVDAARSVLAASGPAPGADGSAHDGTADTACGAYWRAALALVLAAAGDRAGAREAAGSVAADGRSTYLDRALALLAVAAVDVAAGDRVGAGRALDDAAELAADTEDLVTRALVGLARRVLDDPSRPAVPAGPDLAGEGWATALALAAGSGPRAHTGVA